MNDSLLTFPKFRKEDVLERYNNWNIAIGLQGVDLLDVSYRLIQLAKENIKGEITLDKVIEQLNEFYADHKSGNLNRSNKVADYASVKIVEILSNNDFSLDKQTLKNIHGNIFNGLYYHSGNSRNCNITKKEWILSGDTVNYEDYRNIEYKLDVIIEKFKTMEYQNNEDLINKLSFLFSNLWLIHPFLEGNTRTTSVFVIMYLKSKDIKVDGLVFKDYSFYLRNALVRSTYENKQDDEYLKKFLSNAILNTKYELKNRYMKINNKTNNKR